MGKTQLTMALLGLAACLLPVPAVQAAKTKKQTKTATSTKKATPARVTRKRTTVRRATPTQLMMARYVQPDLSTYPEMTSPLPDLLASELHDSFFAARVGRRVHLAIDIMRPTGTPLYACVDGFVEKINTSVLGGKAVYLADAGGTHHFYYAHLSGYAEGLYEGMPVMRGQLIGYVGNTGNARFTGPHLHFQIMQGSTPVNPFPALQAVTAGMIPLRRTVPSVISDAMHIETPEPPPAAEQPEIVVATSSEETAPSVAPPPPPPAPAAVPQTKPRPSGGSVPLVVPDYSIPPA